MSQFSAQNLALQAELQTKLERTELQFNYHLSVVALFGLIVLPLIPGSLSFASIVAHFPTLLGIPLWLAYAIALFTAVGVEVLGLVVIKLALRMRKFNHAAQGWAVTQAPIAQGVSAAVLYLGVVLSLVVLLKVLPGLAVWALIPLACLGAIADWAFALQGDQAEREAELRRLLATDADEQRQANEIAQLHALVEELRQHIADHEVDAAALQERLDYATRQLDAERVRSVAQLDALRTQVSAQSPAVGTPPALQSAALDAVTPEENPTVTRTAKAKRQADLLHILTQEFNGQPADALNKTELAQRLDTTRQTIGRDIEELIEQRRVTINGVVTVLN